jgi:hypothetical protein
VTSEIARVEVKRVVGRMDPAHLELASDELVKIAMVDLSKSVLTTAESFSFAKSH